MEYEKKCKAACERNESFIRELVMKGREDRLWEYYGRDGPEVSRYGYRRKGQV